MKATLILILMTAVWVSPATAQDTRRGTVRGRIVDEVEASIPNAKVTIRSEKGKERTTNTNIEGVFVLKKSRVGTNTLSVTAKGFVPYEQKITVKPGTQELPEIKLLVAVPEAAVEVVSTLEGPSVDPAENKSAIVFDEAMLASLPEDRDELLEVLEEIAGPAARANGEGPELYIDGFRGGRMPSKADIQQIRINSNPMSAEFSHPGWSRIEITTKPGRDRFGGELLVGFNDAVFDARPPFSVTRPPHQQRRFEYSLRGPIIAKRASFSTNFEYNNIQNADTVVATILSGGQVVPFLANIIQPRRDIDFGVRTDWLLWGDKTFNLKFRINDDRTDNDGVGNFALPERAINARARSYTLQGANLSVFSSRVLNELRARLRRKTAHRAALNNGVAINVNEAFQAGGNPQGQSDITTDTAELHEVVSISHKSHNIRIGGRVELEHLSNFRQTNFNGTFIFSNLDQYRRALAGESTFDPTHGDRSPPQFSITRGDPFLGFSTREYAWFFNDDVKLRPNLTVSIGLRHEFQAWLRNKNNFAPRFGLAWSPKTARRTVIRAGAGVFYNHLGPGLIDSVLRLQNHRQEQIIIRGTRTVNIFPNPYVLPPTRGNRLLTERLFAPDIRAPYSMQVSASVEHLFPRGIVANFSYMHSRGAHLYRLRNINAPFPGSGRRPDPARGNVLVTESTGLSNFDMFSVQVQRRLNRFFSFIGNYSLSYAHSDVTSGGGLRNREGGREGGGSGGRGGGLGTLPANNYDLRSEWGPATFDQRHRVFLTGTLSLPWNLRLYSIFSYASPLPFNITTGSDANHDISYTDRPGGIGRNANLPASLYSTIDPRQTIVFSRRQAGFVPPSLRARFDTDPTRDSFLVPVRAFLETVYPHGVTARGPNFINVHMRLSKSFDFGAVQGAPTAKKSDEPDDLDGGGLPSGKREGGGKRSGKRGGGGKRGGRMSRDDGERNPAYHYRLTFSVSAHNLFNHVNYGNYIGTLTSPFFGRANSAREARRIELQLRLSF